jgi:hypothetical protein
VSQVWLSDAQAMWLENALEVFLLGGKNQPIHRRDLLVEFSSRRVIRKLRRGS